ncbi:hypothetical protein, variant 1 [Aphanomyces invadans]|uniref:PHD-type domain-containing protein n=1 Tax=Aphanomyces invadans TaxID=157072 RepID=A0A024UHL0_9STRA|nr:hypothetical protein, variant 1 [Aphanomyces invadans]ETW05352.1 hypothetical protein, variant 1 [Aphanomyces invadans]|eukprot:XP_008866789.1 hypothetical protein, variant 1 [Aphanomyces invadans]
MTRRDRRQPCCRCHSDLNAALFVQCANKERCLSRLHTYCFDPPRIATDNPDPWWCPSCTPPPQSLPSMTDSKIISRKSVSCSDKHATLLFAKKRALPMPRPPRKVPSLVPAVHPLQQVSPAWLKPSEQDTAGHATDDASMTSPRETIPIHPNDPCDPLDWQTFCADKVADLALHPPAKPRHFKFQRIVMAWVHWRRKHNHDRQQRRMHVHMQEYAAKLPRRVMRNDDDVGGAQMGHDQWREKYKADDLTLLDAENDIHYSQGQLKPKSVVRYIIPTAKKPFNGLPPPKPPSLAQPELIQVDSYTIDLTDTPPTVESRASDAARALQDQAKQAQADHDATCRRKRTMRAQLFLQEKHPTTPDDIATASGTKIQRWYRRLRRDRRVRFEQDAAATLINLCIRRHLHRKHRHDKSRRANLAASALLQSQRAADAKLALQLERRRKRARMRIDRFLSRHAVPHLNRRVHAVVRIQALWRRCLCQKAYSRNRRSRAILTIQCAWRQALARLELAKRRERKAVGVLQRHLRGRYVRRVVLVEKKRVAMVEAVAALHAISIPDPATVTTSALLSALGLHYYGIGRWWAAAACVERACRNGFVRDEAATVALAYCHHQTWHTSHDAFNLTRAHDLYVSTLQATHGDPYVLHDYAVVLMERAEYKAGLDILAHVLAVFPQFELAPSAMLWVGVVLLHLDRGDDSVSYFGCLLDTPPPPFSAADMTILCAVGYGRSRNVDACKQGRHRIPVCNLGQLPLALERLMDGR